MATDNTKSATSPDVAIEANCDLVNGNEDIASREKKKKKKKRKKQTKPMASLTDTLGFVFGCGGGLSFLFGIGVFSGIFHGLVFPALAYIFSSSMSKLAGAATNGVDAAREFAFIFMYVGIYSLVVATMQTWAFEVVAYHASHRFRGKWFQALLRQDAAFFDVYDIGGVAGQIGNQSDKFRRGIGRKFGEGIQFTTTGVGGIIFSLYSDWRVSLVIIAMIPFVSMAGLAVMSLNQKKGRLSAESYKHAGGVAYSAVSSIKTVQSLNAIIEMVEMYKAATLEAFISSKSLLLKQGMANGSMLGAMLLLNAVMTLYGTFFLYSNVAATGCDPSGSVPNNNTCRSSGQGVFGAMMGVAFASQGISQVGNFLEALGEARAAVYQALVALNRVPGTAQEIIYRSDADEGGVQSLLSFKRSKEVLDIEKGVPDHVKAILPKFEINSLSTAGLCPDIKGAISFHNVYFSYPSRPKDPVLEGLSLEVEAGTTAALVGPSGGGKSTLAILLERFYDPLSGSVLIDNINIKEMNVSALRRSIGYVGQEPALFATSIRANIQYGNPSATQQEIEEAARLANAHDFIISFTDGYDTQVGDKGSQLSGGQKQRIAIARILVGNPSLLVLDEATSALDAESELVVQDALDNILAQKQITTIIIAHRLSTIRNADKINVIVGGRVEEQGTHNELMSYKSYYRQLVEKQEGPDDDPEGLSEPSGHGSEVEPSAQNESLALNSGKAFSSIAPHIEFQNVCFSYPSRPKKIILDGFNLAIERGKTVALVGPSGSGKSTTVGLIERFYDSQQGQLLYLGNDVRSLNVSWYRSQLSFVGQEPVLFDMTIAANIAFGIKGVTQADIEIAAQKANAHDFIVKFPDGYNTSVGSRGAQLSGGQKQRIAIARSLIRKPQVLVMDEPTSALDNQSEAIVQQTIERLIESEELTVVIISHRLSTIRNADYIALISDGKVIEFGSHKELVEKPNGRFKRLVESSKRRSTVDSVGLKRSTWIKNSECDDVADGQEEDIDWESEIRNEEKTAFSAKQARKMARPDMKYIIVGSFGALLAGAIYPLWGILFSLMISLLFHRVEKCGSPGGGFPEGFSSCQEYWESESSYMRQESFVVAGFWALLLLACLIGNIILFWGFGVASERLNKRVRDASFKSLLRQEASFFDKRSVGFITSQLQDDTARIHAFSGEPIRSLVIALTSILMGLCFSLSFMWQFALVAIGCIPVLGFAASVRMKRMMGEDLGADSADELNSPGGIVVETLLNMRTVAALTLESERFMDFERALTKSEPNYRFDSFFAGAQIGIAMFIQQWVFALLIWFGGYILYNFSDDYSLSDFLVAQFSIYFGIKGLAVALQDVSDRKEVEESAGRILYLLDRKSEIDPLSQEGKKLD